MKTYKNLYPQIYNFGNLYIAFLAARKGKRDRVAVASFEFDLEHNLLGLEAELRDRTYRPGGYTNFYIHEPKRRLVSAAPFHDRVARRVTRCARSSNRSGKSETRAAASRSALPRGRFADRRRQERQNREKTPSTSSLHSVQSVAADQAGAALQAGAKPAPP